MFHENEERCLMIIGETPFITDLYKDFIVAKYPKKYRFRLYNDRVTSESIDNNHFLLLKTIEVV